MEIRAQKNVLKNAVSAAKKALSKVVIQEERGHLLCDVVDDTLSFRSTNNDLKARCVIPVENISKENFSFTIDPKIFEKLISKIDIDSIHMSFDPKEFILKVYTTDSEKSFSSLQSFPPDKMLTFDYTTKTNKTVYPVNKEVLLFALNYASKFLAALKDDQKQFDYVIINKGIVYSANGSNKMGLIVFKAFEKIENIRIRKIILPLYISFVESLPGDDVNIIETDKDIGVESIDGTMYYSFLKSNTNPVNIPKEHIKSEGPYTRIDKNKLIKVIDRIMASNTSSTNTGIKIILSGSGESACLDVSLVSSLKITENFSCVRVDDDQNDIEHAVDYKIFKTILTSFDTDKEVRLHINDDGRAFKIYCSGEVAKNKFILVGIGSYAKIIKNQ